MNKKKKREKRIALLLLAVTLLCQIIPRLDPESVAHVSAAQTESQTLALDALMSSNLSSPSPPEQMIAEDGQNDNNIVEDVTENVSQAGLGELISIVEDTVKAEADNLLEESKRLADKGTRKIAQASASSPKKAERLIRKGNNCLNRSDMISEQASKYRAGANALKWTGVVMNGYNVYNDIVAIQNPNNERTSMRVLETTALATDAILATVSIAAALTTALSPPGLALQLAVGVTATVLHSEAFAEWANNTDSAILDTLDDFFEMLFPWMKTPDGVNCYKPNIYLYSSEKRRALIGFRYPQLLTRTIPDYASEWNVWITEDGTLLGEDGSEYSYLFYESVTSRGLFQTDNGYRVPAEQREKCLERILTQMGFMDSEILDFIEFWDEMLEPDTDYIMYPQDTQTVNCAMPIRIEPEPDSIERIWFVFCEDSGRDVARPDEIVLERSGEYAVVEWGGMIFE